MDAMDHRPHQDEAAGEPQQGRPRPSGVRFEVEGAAATDAQARGDLDDLRFEVEAIRSYLDDLMFQVEAIRPRDRQEPETRAPAAAHGFLALLSGATATPSHRGPAQDMAWLGGRPLPETGDEGSPATATVPPEVQAAVAQIQGWLSGAPDRRHARARSLAQAASATPAAESPQATPATGDHATEEDSWVKPLAKVAFGFGAVLAVSALAILFLTIVYAWMNGWEPITIYANLLGEGRLEALVLGVGLFFSGGMLFHYLSMLRRW